MTLGKAGLYTWVTTRFPYPNGRLVVTGPYSSISEAESASYLEFDQPFSCVELQTRDRQHAVSILKKRNLSNTSDLGSSLQKSMSKIPKAPGTTPDISPNDPLSPYSPN